MAMNHRTFFAALLAGTALASPALAADLAVKAPAVQFAGIPVDWSGVYVGLEGGYGWGKQKFDDVSIGGFGGAGNIDNILNGVGNGVLFPQFSGLSIGDSIKQNGGLFGGFAGVQKQMGSWVLGLEADFDAAWIKGSSAASGVQHGVTVSAFAFGSPDVLSVTDPGQTVTVPGQTLTSTGTALVLGRNVRITGPISLCTNGGTACGPTLAAGTVLTAGTVVGVTQTQNNINNDSVAGPGTIKMVLQQNVTVGAGGVATVTLPFFTVPGQNAAVTVTGTVQPVTVGVGGITSTGTVQASVLQQLQAVTNVTRSVSIDSKIDELGSARGKIGFALAPNFLLYGTGGLAFAHATNDVVATESFTADFGDGTGPHPFKRSVSTSGGATLLGWAVGAGIDWKTPIPNVILGVEYLHYDFPKHTISLADTGSATFAGSRETVDAVKARLSLLFPIH